MDAGADKYGYWGIALTFAGSGTDPSAADRAAGFSAAWSFGDGSVPVPSASATHTYAAAGSYLATLTFRDKDGGTGSGTAAITMWKRPTTLGWTGTTVAAFGYDNLRARIADGVDPATARLAGLSVVLQLGGRSLTGTTDASGAVTFASAPFAPGTYDGTVRFAGNAEYNASQSVVRLDVHSSPGKVTGPGFEIISDGKTVRGELELKTGFHAHTLTALGISADGKNAWFAGVGTDGRSFIAYAEDNGEPGRTDVFRAWIGGALVTDTTGRNVQITRADALGDREEGRRRGDGGGDPRSRSGTS